jgi:hypothetical protein
MEAVCSLETWVRISPTVIKTLIIINATIVTATLMVALVNMATLWPWG